MKINITEKPIPPKQIVGLHRPKTLIRLALEELEIGQCVEVTTPAKNRNNVNNMVYIVSKATGKRFTWRATEYGMDIFRIA